MSKTPREKALDCIGWAKTYLSWAEQALDEGIHIEAASKAISNCAIASYNIADAIEVLADGQRTPTDS